MQLNTVNVIEQDAEGNPISLRSYSDTKIGNESAEELFTAIARETTDLSDEEIQSAIDDGYVDVPGGGRILLTHSTEGGDNTLGYAGRAALADLDRMIQGGDDEDAKNTFITLFEALQDFGADVDDYRDEYDGYVNQ